MLFTPHSVVDNHSHFNPGRICPGRYLALRTVYLVVACVLSVFDIGPVLDEDGNPQIPRIEFDGASVRCVSCSYRFTVRRMLTGLRQGSQFVRMYH